MLIVNVRAVNQNYGGIYDLEKEIIARLNGSFKGSQVIFVSDEYPGRKDLLLWVYYKLNNTSFGPQPFESGWKKTKRDEPKIPGQPVDGLSITHDPGGFEYGSTESTPAEKRAAIGVKSPGTQVRDFSSPVIHYQNQQRQINGTTINPLPQYSLGEEIYSTPHSELETSLLTIRFALERSGDLVWRKRYHSVNHDVFSSGLAGLMDILSWQR